MDHDADYHGSLIAFEGSPDIISTQLRLLPTSPHILILPHIQQYVQDAEDDSDEDEDEQVDDEFDAASLIQRVHDAAAARTKAALQFLRAADPSRKRLVFLNGGSAGCRALCLSSIRQHQTNGSLSQAREVYDSATRDGLAGLRAQSRGLPIQQNSQPRKASADPSAEAMRAAEALDMETASLQPTDIFDLRGPSPRPRSMSVPGPSLPIYDMSDPFGDGTPFFLFGAGSETESDGALRSPISTLGTFGETLGTFGEMGRGRSRAKPPSASMSFRSWKHMMEESRTSTRSPSGAGEARRSESQEPSKDSFLLSPTSESFCSLPGTPGTLDKVVYGEAKLVRVGSTRSSTGRSSGGVKRSRSLDRLSTRSATTGVSQSSTTQTSYYGRRGMSPETVGSWTRPTHQKHLDESRPPIPQQSGTAKRPAIGPPALRLHPVPDSVRSTRTYVDRGSDALDDWQELQADLQSERRSAIEGQVLPFVEDLVVHFKGDSQHAELETIIQELRGQADSAPWSPSEQAIEEDGPLIFPATPTSPEFTILVAPQLTEENPCNKVDVDEYDPYAAHSYNHGNLPLISHPVRASVPFVEVTDPPTPAQTPPPPKTTAVFSQSEDSRFCDFDVSGKQTAVSRQNSLRSLLNSHFPPEEGADQSYHFPMLPTAQDLWLPVFGVAEPGSPRADKRRVDLILAIGAQRGVQDEFAASMIRQLEKLGVNSEGVSRSGRLDLRYLVANAMQTFTAQPLANQTKDNPFANPLLLATLIIPHLETYLAAHTPVRFLLLEYPPEHLATVLAIQRLAGADTIKVAGIVDPSTPLPSLVPSPRRRSGHSRNKSSLQGLESFTTSAEDGLSFARANFLLSATATDSEIEAFLAAIWSVLMDISTFYVPSPEPAHVEKLPRDRPSCTPRNSGISKAPARLSSSPPSVTAFPTATPTNNSRTSKVETVPRSSRSSTNHYTPLPPLPRTSSIAATTKPITSHPNAPPIPTAYRPTSPSPSLRSSRAASVRTARTGRSAYTTKSTRIRRQARSAYGEEKEVDGLSLADWGDLDEEEAEFDLVEERRLMPLYVRRRGARKANRHKALRWLGLA